MRILLHSNAPWARTGYGQQTEQLSTRLRRAGHEVAISAFWGLGGAVLDYDGMKVYPADEKWGNKWLVACAADYGHGDPTSVLVLTLMDVWVLTQPLFKNLRMACWVPVDHEPVPPNVANFFKRTGATVIAMSRYGQAALHDAGVEALYVPHGIDADLFKPIPQAEARRTTGSVPMDAFVVGMVANNKGNALPRKAFPEVFEAFGRFHRKHPDAFLYLHTSMEEESGLNLWELAKVMGIPREAIACTPPFELYMGIDAWKMPWVYSQFDVLINPSLGEGFGIPIIEAQACGVPVIVNDHSAMPELLGAGDIVSGKRLYDPSQGAWFQTPDVDLLEQALENAYRYRGGGNQAARDFAVQYDADRVYEEHWTTVLEQITADTRMPAVTLEPVAA